MTKTDGRKLDHKTSEHFRRLAVRRVVEGGEMPSEVMRSLGLCRTTIYQWLRAYESKGHEALTARKALDQRPSSPENNASRSGAGSSARIRDSMGLHLDCGRGASSSN